MVMSCKTFNLAQIEWNYFQFPLTEQFIFMRLGPDTPCSFQEEIVWKQYLTFSQSDHHVWKAAQGTFVSISGVQRARFELAV